MLSPLTGNAVTQLLGSLDVQPLVDAWGRRFGINVRPEFHGCETIYHYRCEETGLEFFRPDELAGGGSLYAALERHPWYYMPWKWEHRRALRDLAGSRRVLEIGCGRGEFVARLQEHGGSTVEGLELNASAVEAARARGLSVMQRDLYDFAPCQAGQYDAVCAFQVLEHVPDPGRFLAAAIQLLKAGGQLIVSVPNGESLLLRSGTSLLDLPPHHMSRWNLGVFERLQQMLPVRLVQHHFEPLASYHTAEFMAGWLGADRRFMSRAARLVGRGVLRILPPLRYLLRGHTLYLRFEKCPEVSDGSPPSRHGTARHLDTDPDGTVYKPDSPDMEAIRP